MQYAIMPNLLVTLFQLSVTSLALAFFAAAVLPNGYLYTLTGETLAEFGTLFDSRELLGTPDSEGFGVGSGENRSHTRS